MLNTANITNQRPSIMSNFFE